MLREDGKGPRRKAEADLTRRRGGRGRSEEHTSELQSLTNVVCRLLLVKKKRPRVANGDCGHGLLIVNIHHAYSRFDVSFLLEIAVPRSSIFALVSQDYSLFSDGAVTE